MELEKKGYEGLNAEVLIDYKNNIIDFNYPQIKSKKEINKKRILGYAGDKYPFYLSLAIGIIISMYSGSILIKTLGEEPINLFIIYPFSFGWMIAILNLGMFINVLLNLTIKSYRENYPKRQKSIFRKTVELNLPETNGKQIIEDNKLYILDYTISDFEYEYIGNNKINKIYTKSIEENKHEGEHFEFVCVVEFDKKITDGTFTYKTDK